MICSKCCYCSVVGSKFFCSVKHEKIVWHREICSHFLPVKNCDRCKNDPAFFNDMRELCNPCEFDYEVAKPKITNLDHIRIADIDQIISWFCRGRLCSTCPYNGIECGIRDWLMQEIPECGNGG